MDVRLVKIAVGLALESDVSNRRRNQSLFNLYSNPNLEGVRSLYSEIKDSGNHYDREVSIWLSSALEMEPQELDMKDLIQEFIEMEWLLYHMLEDVDTSHRQEVSDWMNYIVNAAQSLEDGWHLDAKLCVNLALEHSRRDSIEELKESPVLRYLINLLQAETLRRFRQIREIPYKLSVPEERLDLIVGVQEILIDLLSGYYLKELEDPISEFVGYALPKFRSSMRHLMLSDFDFDKALVELKTLSELLRDWKGETKDHKITNFTNELSQRVTSLIGAT